ETVLLKEYSQVLVQKLEQKVMQLEACEQYSHKLFDLAPDGILITDTANLCLDANPSLCRMLGYHRDELIELHATDIVAAPEFEFIQTALDEINARSDYPREWQFRRKDGSVFAAEVSVTTIPDGKLLATVRDITERKRAEQALQESSAKLRLFIHYAPSAIAMFDRDMRYLAYSQRWLTDYGLGEQELAGRSHYEIFPDLPARWKAIHQHCLAGAIEKCEEDPFPRANGSVDWVRWEIHPWHTGTGDIGGIIIFTEVITARKQTEALLVNSEAAFRALFESSRDAIMTANVGENFLSGNPAAVALFGCRDVQEFLTQSPASVSPEFQPDGRRSDEKAQEMMRLARDSGSCFFEWTHRRMDGTEFFADVLLTLTETGGKQLIQATVRDISERKQAETFLRLRDTQLTLIFDNVSDVIFLIEVDGDGEFRFVSMNRRGLELTGLTKDQIFGQRVVDVIPASAHGLVLGKYRQAIATRQPASWEEVSDYPAGRKYGIVTVAPVFATSGRCTQLVGTVHDLTEHKQAEAELRIAATAFDSHEGMLITDANVRILKVNRAFTTITGYSAEEVIGKNPNLLSSGRQGADFYAAMWTSLKDNSTWEGEIWNRRKNGEIYPEHRTITAVKDAQGNVTNYVGALTDSTQRQQTLDQLRSTASELEQANAQI
ncbi:MAG: PAS domain S-box protein, partial [Gallionella sp.]|nr:PAS domain S-box protein [Gallionella sp.]